MNTTDPPRRNAADGQDGRRRDIEKTYIEDLSETGTFTRLGPGTRIHASSIGNTNPYAIQRYRHYDELPRADERVQLGSGVVAGILGDGGMARVYKIWNQKLEVFRAVKVLLPDQSDSVRSRFETEAKITAKLRHPHIVEIHSVGEYNGLPFIEMELVDGVSLEQLLATHGRLPPKVCCAIGIAVAEALAYAHTCRIMLYGTTYQGVIHRDLKPANIMVASNGTVKLMDFGIARPTDVGLHTAEGTIVGTMQYLSPEQLDGTDVDGRTDIYSFGAILYELLTGVKTFPQNTITSLMRKKSVNDYRSFSAFDFSVHRGLAAIARRCLALDRKQRFPTAESLLGALRQCHASLSRETPDDVLREFMRNPATAMAAFTGRSAPRVLRRAGVVVLGAAVILAIGATVLRLLVRSPAVPVSAPPTPSQPPSSRTSHMNIPATPPAEVSKAEPPAIPRPPIAPAATPSENRIPASAKPPHSPRKAQPAPVRPPLEQLTAKYATRDLLAIGKTALTARAYGDAALALAAVPTGDAQYPAAQVLLAATFLAAGRTAEAAEAARVAGDLRDGALDVVRGRLAESQGDIEQALSLYQSAILKPSTVMDIGEVRSDALYRIARIRTNQYRTAPSAETRLQALNAWLALKKHHAAQPEHPRFREANAAMADVR